MYTRDDLKNNRIAVLMGGLSAEREISLKSGDAVLKGLLRKGYNAVPIDVDRNLPSVLISEGIDIVFVALHGRFGEDGTLQGLLEMMGMPYTGSGVLGSALAMDKCLSKVFLESHKVPTPAYHVCASPDDTPFPCLLWQSLPVRVLRWVYPLSIKRRRQLLPSEKLLTVIPKSFLRAS